ncbi:MAG TPA: GAF domain-containing sensor histidine kinase [Candidatus Sulfomarinibacteraceae bacterium]|nr:GAF domain-containing sensor histidine kinase [Candidatus Sulfomarinibacteraceae bacterium]
MHVATAAYALNLTLGWPLYAHVENIALILMETIYYPAIFIPLFLIPLYFPDGQLLSPRWRLLVGLILFILIWTFVATAIRPWPVPQMGIAQTRMLNGIPGSEPFVDGVTAVTGWLWPLVPPLVVLSTVLRWRRMTGRVRKQMKLPMFATASVIVVAVVLWSVPQLSTLDERSGYTVTWLLAIFIPVSFGVAILSQGLWDIDIIISRTMVYGGLSAAIVAIYASVVAIAGFLFATWSSYYVGLFAAVLIAFLFQPLRERLQYYASRLLYGQRDDPVGMLTSLARRLEMVDDSERIFPTLVETVAAALRLPYVAIWLPRESRAPDGTQEKQWEQVAATGNPARCHLLLPMQYRNHEIGRLEVAPRGKNEPFSQEDERLLVTIAQLSATAVHAARQTIELQRSRRLLITGREEERRRLRRDLHDGLGPVLAAVALQADTAYDLAETDPDETKALLDSIRQHTQTAVADIRLLVHGLRPPTLDELGLVAALQQSARAYRHTLHVQIQAQQLPPLPAAVEVAAFRIVQEALNNVVKHAQAHACIVTISGDDVLCLVVDDDGIGYSAANVPGVGLISIRERAAELGGHCAVRQRPSGGTRVEVLLPLAAGDNH